MEFPASVVFLNIGLNYCWRSDVQSRIDVANWASFKIYFLHHSNKSLQISSLAMTHISCHISSGCFVNALCFQWHHGRHKVSGRFHQAGLKMTICNVQMLRRVNVSNSTDINRIFIQQPCRFNENRSPLECEITFCVHLCKEGK